MEKNLKIYENFLEEKYFKFLKNTVTNPFFPWYLCQGVSSDSDNHIQFTHILYEDNEVRSDFYNELKKLLEKLNYKKLIRLKLNLLPKTYKKIIHGMHIDIEPPINDGKTAIFYFNTNNGETIFEDKTVIKSVENKLISFNSFIKHSGSTNTDDNNYRIVLNINFL